MRETLTDVHSLVIVTLARHCRCCVLHNEKTDRRLQPPTQIGDEVMVCFFYTAFVHVYSYRATLGLYKFFVVIFCRVLFVSLSRE